MVEAFAHDLYPFSLMVERTRSDRDFGSSPVFQVMFGFHKAFGGYSEDFAHLALGAAGGQMNMGGLHLESVQFEERTAQFDLTLTMSEGRRGLVGVWQFNTDILQASTVDRWSGCFERLLEGIADCPEEILDRLPLLKEEERQQLLGEWSRTERTYPQIKYLHNIFEEQVASCPEAVAVFFEHQHLTYAQLNARANQLAHYLKELGAGPETRIGICVERSLEMVVGLLGILKADGAYVPMDPDYPVNRLEYIAGDAGVRWILSQAHLGTRLGQWPGEIIYLDLDWAKISTKPKSNQQSAVIGQNLAYVIYTSGSSGAPKGVMVSHSAIANHMSWMQEAFPSEDVDRVLQKTAFTFDASVWEFYVPLLNGGRLVMARPGGQRDERYLVESMEAEEITVVQLVPSQLLMLLAGGGLKRCRMLKRVYCGGEVLTTEMVKAFYEQAPWADLYNLYGPTEATIDAACWACARDENRLNVPVGRPVGNVRVYVLDREMQPVPVGIAGEICIGGVQLARGYLVKPDLTAERFVSNPFDEKGGGRLYRTGDLARYVPGGVIEYLGRMDNQVKVRGFRIEPGEIETVLIAETGVKQAVVIAHEDESGRRRLVAYVVPQEEISKDQLREALLKRLPEYMVPSVFLIMQALPITASGKVDRKALPLPDVWDSGSSNPTVECTVVEQILAGIWCNLLNLDRVGLTDRFFELGGHSLAATQVISRVRAVFGTELPLQALFESPTIAGLAKRVEQNLRQGLRAEIPPITPCPRGAPLQLSFNQQRLWFLHQLDPGSCVYNCPVAVQLRGRLNREALQHSLSAVVGRHEVLRTTFPVVNGKAVQQIEPAEVLDLPLIDLTALPDEERERELDRLAAEEAMAPFDLSRGPVLRFRLLWSGLDEHTLLLNIHHISTDGWSAEIFVRECAELYAACVEGRKARLEDVKLQYADFAMWQRNWLSGDLLEEQLQYWRKQLADAEILELPTDYPRSLQPGSAGETLAFELPVSLTQRLKKVSHREGVTLFMTLLPAFQVVLGHRAGQDDVVVGTDIANRNNAQTEGLIGFFINQLVLRIDLSGDPTFRELLGRVRTTVLQAHDHQDLPFEKLVDDMSPVRNLNRSPLFQAKLVLQNMPQASSVVEGLEISCRNQSLKTAKFDLTLTMQEVLDTLTGTFNYKSELFSPDTITLLKEQFIEVLAKMTAEPDIRLSRLRESLDIIWAGFRAQRDLKLEQQFSQQLKLGQRRAVERQSL